MITNFYTLVHVTAELNQKFSGRSVHHVFTQNRGELVLSFRETESAILIGCEPANNYIFSRKTFTRAHRNSTDIFADMSGAIMEDIFIHPKDRQIYFRLKDSRILIAQLFGSKANILFLDANGFVVDSFLKSAVLNKMKLDMPQRDQRAGMMERIDSDSVVRYGDQPIGKVLKQVFSEFGPVLIQELLTREGIRIEQPVAGLSDHEIDYLFKTAERLKEELLSRPSPRVYTSNTMPLRFSLIPLKHMDGFEFQQYDSVSEAIAAFRASARHEKEFLHEKEEIIKALVREKVLLEKATQKISAEPETDNQAEHYEKYGKLLIANLHTATKGDTTIIAEDFMSSSHELLEIPLDPHLSPAKNAERYFEKAEKSRRAVQERNLRASALAARHVLVARLLDRMEEVVTKDDLLRFAGENKIELSQFGLTIDKKGHEQKKEPTPFRVFTVAGDFQVWAGKSGENNDLLSTRHTAKNDLWFHARGVGGSHVVLKVGTGKGEVSKHAIEQAAAIAAYYSKMKNSKLVPVAMCEGKYVRKPKGVPAGTVTLEREKTIFVEPHLPQHD
jgi:predicted ribosome quality control (RQC) complex YloA/Tae2 family protein